MKNIGEETVDPMKITEVIKLVISNLCLKVFLSMCDVYFKTCVFS